MLVISDAVMQLFAAYNTIGNLLCSKMSFVAEKSQAIISYT